MKLPRRFLSALLVISILLASCGGEDSRDADEAASVSESDEGLDAEDGEGEESGIEASHPEADALRAGLAGHAEYEFESAVFVLEDGEIGLSGDTERHYSFDSVTKTMTGLLLAHLHEEDQLDLSTPIGEILEAGDNGDITMLELATHTSGLPEAGDNWDQWEGFTEEQPYAGYTAEMAEADLQSAELDEDVDYSNLAFQLLGMCIEAAAETTLGEMAEELIFEPAGMDTAEIPVGDRNLPDGLLDGEPRPAWDNLLTGDGGAGGSIEDLAAYAQFMLFPPAESAEAVDLATAAHIQDDELSGAGLDWFITPSGLRWHAGASDAYNSVVVLDQDNDRAVGYLTATGDLDDEAIDLFLDYLAT